MIKILELRSLLRAYYQKFQMVVDPVMKFLLAFVTFRLLNSVLGYEERLGMTVVVLLVSLLCAFKVMSQQKRIFFFWATKAIQPENNFLFIFLTTWAVCHVDPSVH